MSSDIQNECLQLMALSILSFKIGTNGFFAVMADECTDIYSSLFAFDGLMIVLLIMKKSLDSTVLEQLMLLLLWQANADNIIKRGIFMGKMNYCIGKFFLHWQIYVCMGNFIIAWENLLLHWQICLHGQFYYCMGKSSLYGHNYFAWVVFMGNYCVCNEGLVAKSRTKLAIFMRIILLRLIAAFTQMCIIKLR